MAAASLVTPPLTPHEHPCYHLPMQPLATTLTAPRSAAGSTQTPVPSRSKSSQARTICVPNAPQNRSRMSTPQIRNGSKWNSLERFFGVRAAPTVFGSRLGPVSRHAAGRLTAPTPVRGPVIHSWPCIRYGRTATIRAVGVWRSMVARVVRDDEALGSSPSTPTTFRGRRRPGIPSTRSGESFERVVLAHVAGASGQTGTSGSWTYA